MGDPVRGASYKGVRIGISIEPWTWPRVDIRAVAVVALPFFVMLIGDGILREREAEKLDECSRILAVDVEDLKVRQAELRDRLVEKELELMAERRRMKNPFFVDKNSPLYATIPGGGKNAEFDATEDQ